MYRSLTSRRGRLGVAIVWGSTVLLTWCYLSAPLVRRLAAVLDVRYGTGEYVPDLALRDLAGGIDPSEVKMVRFWGEAFGFTHRSEAISLDDPALIRALVESLQSAARYRSIVQWRPDHLELVLKHKARCHHPIQIAFSLRARRTDLGPQFDEAVASLSHLQGERLRAMLRAYAPLVDRLDVPNGDSMVSITGKSQLARSLQALTAAGATVCSYTDDCSPSILVRLHIRGRDLKPLVLVFPYLTRAGSVCLPEPLRRWY
ncbi:MAG TPA: hypothetical protein VGS41_00930, partial [Chthonomonadales bacterium]|nr:hypothetical protein [Chthonomonadales bacterium]